MENRKFKQVAFFIAFAAGTIAVVLYLQSKPLKAESQTQSTVQETKQSSSTPTEKLNYDKARYNEIKSAVESIIENKMQKDFSSVPFDEVSQNLSLENVPWDKAYSNNFFGETRIYHFQGFYLILSLKMRMPDNPPTWTSEDLKKKGTLCVYHFYPAVHIDGMSDPKERMRIYWEGIKENFRKRNEELNRAKENKNN